MESINFVKMNVQNKKRNKGRKEEEKKGKRGERPINQSMKTNKNRNRIT